MANGDHDWTAGEQVTAANVDDYLQLQTVQKFATSAARDSALTARKREGMVTYQDDANCLTNYSGAAWSTIGPVNGALTAWTPVVVQSATPSLTVTYATYSRVGRQITAQCLVTITGPGVANNMITCTLPVAAQATAVSNQAPIGTGFILDSSAGFRFRSFVSLITSTTAFFIFPIGGAAPTDALSQLGNGSYNAALQFALASADIVSYQISYEAAADA